jgi:hypothetical protein
LATRSPRATRAHPKLAELIKAVIDVVRGTQIEDRISKLMAQLELASTRNRDRHLTALVTLRGSTSSLP